MWKIKVAPPRARSRRLFLSFRWHAARAAGRFSADEVRYFSDKNGSFSTPGVLQKTLPPFQFAGAAPAAGRKQASLVARFFPGLFTNTIGMESEQRTEFGLHGRTDLVEL